MEFLDALFSSDNLDSLISTLSGGASFTDEISGDSIRTSRASSTSSLAGFDSAKLQGLLKIGANYVGEDLMRNEKAEAEQKATSFSPEGMQNLMLLNALGKKILEQPEFTKDQALLDSQRVSEAALKKILQIGLPKIYGGQAGSGAYGSTTAQLLQDNLFVEAQDAAAKTQLETINAYARNRQLELEPLYRSLGVEENLLANRTKLADIQSRNKGGSGSSKTSSLIKAGLTLGKLFGVGI